MGEKFFLMSEEMQNKEGYSSKEESFCFSLVSNPLVIVTVTNRGHKDDVVPVGIVTMNCEPACVI